jgi:SAM-dependent methyltransferase
MSWLSRSNGLPMKKRMKRSLRTPYLFFARLFFNPMGVASRIINTIRALPIYIANLSRYSRANSRDSLRFSVRDAWFHTYDRFSAAASLTEHYFWQDLWAATKLHDASVVQHVDVASRVDGFVGHVLTFCEVTYVDIRPLALNWPTFHFQRGSILALPFADESVRSLSSLHVIEHIGLGRYGDAVDPEGPWKAARELMRVLAPGGRLLLGVPTGRERVCFDAHRVFAPETTIDMFSSLELVSF